MPLIKSASKKAFKKNVEAEMNAHPGRNAQNLAIAYSMKRKAEKKKMKGGGEVKGVHPQQKNFPGGQSEAGQSARVYKRESDKTVIGADKNYELQDLAESNAKQKHQRVLSELKSMPDPKLKGLAHGGEMKACAHCGHYADGEQVPAPTPSPDPFQALANSHVHPSDISKAAKSTGLSKGGLAMKPSGAFDSMKMDDEMLHDDLLTGDSYQLRPTQFNKAHVAHNSGASHEDSMGFNQHHPDMQASTDMHEEDLVDRIMKQREKDFSSEARFAKGGYLEGKEMYPHAKGKMFDTTNKYSQGGKVANDTGTGQEADKLPNQYDDLVLRDDLESSYGDDDNAGDALGNAQEDKDRSDIVARIMKSRKKKDRLPSPA